MATTAALPVLSIDKFSAPLRQRVESAIRNAIVSGELAPNRRLTERELIEMTGASRTLVREALRQLEAERLIAVTPNKGAVVRNLTPAEATEIYAVRAVLEGLAAREFTRNAGDATRAQLEAAAAAAIEAYERDDLTAALEQHNRFYDVLFDGAGNETLHSILATLHARVLRWRALGLMHSARSPGRSKETVRGLKSMVAEIRRGCAEGAERAARAHAERGAAEVMKLLAESQRARSARRA
jgi:DNA-binding GntR family transcriptional regulator